VIFYTAYYLEEEALQLAKACGVIDHPRQAIRSGRCDPRVVDKALAVRNEGPATACRSPSSTGSTCS